MGNEKLYLFLWKLQMADAPFELRYHGVSQAVEVKVWSLSRYWEVMFYSDGKVDLEEFCSSETWHDDGVDFQRVFSEFRTSTTREP